MRTGIPTDQVFPVQIASIGGNVWSLKHAPGAELTQSRTVGCGRVTSLIGNWLGCFADGRRDGRPCFGGRGLDILDALSSGCAPLSVRWRQGLGKGTTGERLTQPRSGGSAHACLSTRNSTSHGIFLIGLSLIGRFFRAPLLEHLLAR